MEIYDIWSKMDGIHSRQEKSIGSLLVKLLMICDFVIEWWLLWGSGRAARHDPFEQPLYHYTVHCFINCWMPYCISCTRIVDDRRQPRCGRNLWYRYRDDLILLIVLYSIKHMFSLIISYWRRFMINLLNYFYLTGFIIHHIDMF